MTFARWRVAQNGQRRSGRPFQPRDRARFILDHLRQITGVSERQGSLR